MQGVEAAVAPKQFVNNGLFQDAAKIETRSEELAQQLLEECGGIDNLVVLPIMTGGVGFGNLLMRAIHRMTGQVPLNCSWRVEKFTHDLGYCYPDHRAHLTCAPFTTELQMAIEQERIIAIADDVVFEGHTGHASTAHLLELGAKLKQIIQIALVDRCGFLKVGSSPNLAGWRIQTGKNQVVHCCFPDCHGEKELKVMIDPIPTPDGVA
ncbi:MAG: hypothetical protein A2666_01285 [Parcubacteria group bacterium RIFCSPHIGHO2_01_FULL_47_10b]|nr:MAG: hypothetical protein A2666_01285 [Parcubacteria group bacterium RIFCSPHIGHO2_01_FULL_47_10b]